MEEIINENKGTEVSVIASSKDDSKKKRFETRVKTRALEQLHLAKHIVPTSSINRCYKRGTGYIEDTVYVYEVSVVCENTKYTGIVAHSNSEQDALNKLNDAIYERAKVVDVLLLRSVNEELKKIDEMNLIRKKRKEEKKKAANQVESKKTDADETESSVA